MVLRKLALAARMQRLDPLFVPYREAVVELKRAYPEGRFEWLPYGADTRFFRPHNVKKDIFVLWMGRRHEPLHRAILRYCEERGHEYVYRQKSNPQFDSNDDLGLMAARAEYFVATPPDLDNVARTGGYSPMTMRYIEGLAAGARMMGVLPRSGEYETLLPRDALLTVAPDGSDFAECLDADRADESRWEVVRRAQTYVLNEHSWQRRAEQVYKRIHSGTVAFSL